jgi:hypothetical protein
VIIHWKEDAGCAPESLQKIRKNSAFQKLSVNVHKTVDQKYLESFEMWCWSRMENISWTDHVRNEDVLLRVKAQRNSLHEIRKRKANWIGHILRRNCLPQRVTEGKIQGGIEVTGRQGRRLRKLLYDLKKR